MTTDHLYSALLAAFVGLLLSGSGLLDRADAAPAAPPVQTSAPAVAP